MIFQPGKFLRLFYEGLGNIYYDLPAAAAPNVVDAANDGLSTDLATAKIAQLGQAVGRAGDPAILLEDREIPNPGAFTVFFGKNDGVSDVVGINSGAGVSIGNASGQGLLIFAFGINWNFAILSATQIQQVLGSENWLYDNVTKRIKFSNTIIAGGGLGANVRAPATAAIVTALKNDYTLLIDTSGGNCQLNIDPAVFANQVLNIKKLTADFNNITLTPTSGTIQGIGAPAATFVFNTQGQSVTLQSDGTNIYIL
jgi:hypothetical protein